MAYTKEPVIVTRVACAKKAATCDVTYGEQTGAALLSSNQVLANGSQFSNGVSCRRETNSECHGGLNGDVLGNAIDKNRALPVDDCRFPSGKVSKEWKLRANPRVLGCINPIRIITDSLTVSNNGKELVSLAVGDPAMYGSHMRVPDAAVAALVDVTKGCKFNGYTPSTGLPECRRAVADYLSQSLHFEHSADDVIMTVGCTQAIQHCVSVLSFNECNMLLPRPGYPIYGTICDYFGVETRYYDLLQDKGWEVNLDHMMELVDGHTAAIILNNPGNPSGSVYGCKHLLKIASFAEAMKIPIISDEIYADMVFGDQEFVPMAKFSSKVPVLTVGGVSKRWLAPSWRLGWIAISDPLRILEKARIVEGLYKLMQVALGPSGLMQAAFPIVLKNTPPAFLGKLKESLRTGADFCYQRIRKIHGLECPVKPQGSMFMMVRIDVQKFEGFRNDREFATALMNEESVLVLPGAAFGFPNWLRIVFALSLSSLTEAWDRIEVFCARHAV